VAAVRQPPERDQADLDVTRHSSPHVAEQVCIAGYRVLHRLIVPRHPPYTLFCFNNP
jgi:hypothetical protein